MPLNLQAEFAALDILTVKKLGDDKQPVFLLVGPIDQLVIKQESTPFPGDPRNMRYALRTMRAIDPATASRQLSKREIDALMAFVEDEKADADLPGATPNPDLAKLERALLNAVGATWQKMNKLDGLVSLQDAAVQARARKRNKAGVRAIAAALTAPGGLERLGAILVADLFNGNDDRFSLDDQSAQFDFLGLSFRRMTNMANVVLCLQDNVLTPVGLDPYACRGEFRYLDKPTVDPRWPGRQLARTPQAGLWRKTFAADVVSDLETALGPRNRKILFASTNRLPKNAADRIAAGMEEGIRRLKKKLYEGVKPGQVDRIPPGLRARLVVLERLGWGDR